MQTARRTWATTIHKCHNPKSTIFHKYGAKGVTVCDRWRESFEAFVEDMGFVPSPAHSIDRIDNARVYSRETCRWATETQQQRNRTNNVHLTYRGTEYVRAALLEVATTLGVTESAFDSRINRGWSVENAVEKPLQRQRRTKRNACYRRAVKLEYNGERYTVSELAKMFGLVPRTLRWRLKAGWPLLRALRSPSKFPAPHRQLLVEPLI